MITEIPSASDFQAAGLNQLYLAWQIALKAVEDLEEAEGLAEDLEDHEKSKASAEYWAKSQPALANAFGLVQQAMEMALKGRIAAVSPFLLITRDPKDWPKGVDTGAVAFSDFRTIDAADLLKVHNSVAGVPLNDGFRSFWDEVRRDRNRVMHSVRPKSFDPATLVRSILTAAVELFAEMRWCERLLAMEVEGKFAAYGLEDAGQNIVMRQIDIAIRHLEPSEKKKFFGFDVKRRAYLCPECYSLANTDWQDSWPKLAQFTERKPGARQLHCVVCDKTVEVDRSNCSRAKCKGNAIYEGMCLTCVRYQD